MKKLLLSTGFIIFIAYLGSAQTANLEQFIEKYRNKNDVFHLSMPGWVVRMGARIAADDKEEKLELQALAKGIAHIRLLVFNDVAEPPLAEDVDGLISGARKANFQDLALIRHGRQKVQLMIREDKNIVNDLLLMVGGDDRNKKNSVLISISGAFSMDDVNRWLSKIKIDKQD